MCSISSVLELVLSYVGVQKLVVGSKTLDFAVERSDKLRMDSGLLRSLRPNIHKSWCTSELLVVYFDCIVKLADMLKSIEKWSGFYREIWSRFCANILFKSCEKVFSFGWITLCVPFPWTLWDENILSILFFRTLDNNSIKYCD